MRSAAFSAGVLSALSTSGGRICMRCHLTIPRLANIYHAIPDARLDQARRLHQLCVERILHCRLVHLARHGVCHPPTAP